MKNFKHATSALSCFASLFISSCCGRVNFFMNKFRKLGFLDYDGGLQVNSSLLSVVLHCKVKLQSILTTITIFQANPLSPKASRGTSSVQVEQTDVRPFV